MGFRLQQKSITLNDPQRKVTANLKTTSPKFKPPIKGTPSNFAVKLTMLKDKNLPYLYVKPLDPIFSRLVTMYSCYKQTTDRQHIMTIAGHCNAQVR